MNIYKFKTGLTGLTMLLCLSAFSQTETELWSGYVYKLKLNKKWLLEFQGQLRFDENIGHFNKAFTQIGGQYEVLNNLDLEVSYRYYGVNGGWNVGRLNLNVKYKWEPQKTDFKFKYRLRFTDALVQYTGQKVTYLRNSFTVGYKLSKLVDPYIAYENFYRLNLLKEVRRHRYTFGLAWDLTKRLSLDTFYRYETEVNVKSPEPVTIIGLGLTQKGKLKKKKKS